MKFTKWINISNHPIYDGIYDVQFSNGKEERIEFSKNRWHADVQMIKQWRGLDNKYTPEERAVFRQEAHDGRFSTNKDKAIEGALSLARSFVLKTERFAIRKDIASDRSQQLRRSACGWYQIAKRLGYDFSIPADVQAQERNWKKLSLDEQSSIHGIADRFADGSGNKKVATHLFRH